MNRAVGEERHWTRRAYGTREDVPAARSDEIKGLVGKKTRTYDARQMMIVPGFIDTHNHGRGEVLLYNVLVGNPFEVEFVTIQSIIDKLRARAATTRN